VLTGDAILGFAADWTGRYPAARGCRRSAPGYGGSGGGAGVVHGRRPGGRPAGGQHRPGRRGVPRHGEAVLSLTRLDELGPVDQEAAQVTAGAGVTLRRRRPTQGWTLASSSPAGTAPPWAGRWRRTPARCVFCGSDRCGRNCAASRPCSRTARWCPTWPELVKDNTGYDYPWLLAGSDGTLAAITAARCGWLCVPKTYATRRYSWIMPPARSRRRRRKWSRSVTPSGSGRTGAGAAAGKMPPGSRGQPSQGEAGPPGGAAPSLS
jgi:hypothetical protein